MGGFPSTLFVLTAAQVGLDNLEKDKNDMMNHLYQVNSLLPEDKKKFTNFSLYYLAKFDSN